MKIYYFFILLLAFRICNVNGIWYEIKYDYNEDIFMTPAVENGKPHFYSVNSVYKLGKDGKKIFIGIENGLYVPGGCFEDRCENIVKEVLEKVNK